jgi:hypothetical protein
VAILIIAKIIDLKPKIYDCVIIDKTWLIIPKAGIIKT